VPLANVSFDPKEIAMIRHIAFLLSFYLLSAAQAVEVQDAPIPEPNYWGIFVFLLLFVGGSVWFIWSIMHKDKKDKQDTQHHAK
jgi:hypothetical protein